MRPSEIEAWAQKVMDRVVRGAPTEDARVELKRDWIDDHAMARRIAGHANAARSDRILWLIGVDERGRTVPGATARDAAAWYKTLTSSFDGIAPNLIDVVVHRDDRTVVALLFETDRPPYVVKNPAFGVTQGVVISREVPWREGTSVRTARREDMFRILVPQATLPECELRRVASKGGGHGQHPPPNDALALFWFYFVSSSPQRLFIPYHRCSARIRSPDREWVALGSLHFEEDIGELSHVGGARGSHSISAIDTELIVAGAGGAVLIGTYPLLVRREGGPLGGLDSSVDLAGPLEIDLALQVAGVDAPLRIVARLEQASIHGPDESARWLPIPLGQEVSEASPAISEGEVESSEAPAAR